MARNLIFIIELFATVMGLVIVASVIASAVGLMLVHALGG